jgi:hypothetical protein
MAGPGTVDAAGRAIAGLLTYNPGPGIYSRLERAIQAMPENVRTQELPGLLKRYKDGVPGWELKETDLDSVIAGRDVVPREELLARVKERSPVYTHKEVVLADTPPMETIPGAFSGLPHYQDEASAIGRGIAHGDPKYPDYGQGGRDYTEILLTQPGARSAGEYYNHWGQAATQATSANRDAVAHARFDTHGDALRINELQSDLGIHNRKAREIPESYEPPGSFDRVARGRELPFPLEDSWSDLLIKRLALEAARKGHRAIEVASPRAIADKVGGNIDNYEHFYGKVVPGALERLGRKMGGLVEDAPSTHSGWTLEPWDKELSPLRNQAMQAIPDRADGAYRNLVNSYITNEGPEIIAKRAAELAERATPVYANDMPRIVFLAEREAAARRAWMEARKEMQFSDGVPPPARRYLMSDEMRRRIIQEGIPAAVAIGIGADQLIDRLGQEQR